MHMTNGVESTFQPSTADKDVHFAMQLLSAALNEYIHKCLPSKPAYKTRALFHQLVDLILADWSSFFAQPKALRYRKTFQRALGIQPQLAHLHEESFDIDRHQHDLECLARIALSIKRHDIEEEIRKRLPYQPQLNPAKSTNGTKTKELWVQLKNEGKQLLENKQWALAMIRFSQAIGLNLEEAVLYSGRALCEIRLCKFQLAIEDSEDAIELNPKCPEYKRILSEASCGLQPSHQGTKSTPVDVYNLGLSYYYGKGEFVQDLLKAETHFKMAADAGYMEAKLMMGKLLLNKGKSDDALPYIQGAADHGVPEAQYELGRMLIYGDGCPRNESMAKKLLLKAQGQGFKPEEAKATKWVDEMIEGVKALLLFESENNLDTTMTLAKRLERFESYNCFQFSGIDDLLECAVRFETRLPAVAINSVLKPAIHKWMPLMMKRAQSGSFKAQSFFAAHQLIVQAKGLLQKNKTSEALQMLREAHRLWDCPIIDTSIFVKAAQEMVNKKIDNAEAYHLLACTNNSSPTKNHLWMATRSVELDPLIPDFHHALGRIYGILGDYQRGLRSIDRALQLQVHPDWLYDRASFLRLSRNKLDFQVIEAYQKFLSVSPPDGRFVPQANYCISLAYHVLSNVKKTDAYLRKGQKAETQDVRLPCFKSVNKGDFVPKDILEDLYKIHRHKSKVEKKSKKPKIFEIFCAVCSRCNPSQFCVFCRKWVCGLDEYDTNGGLHVCQKSHIAHHKSLVFAVPPPS